MRCGKRRQPVEPTVAVFRKSRPQSQALGVPPRAPRGVSRVPGPRHGNIAGYRRFPQRQFTAAASLGGVPSTVGHCGAAVRLAKAKFCCSTTRELRSCRRSGRRRTDLAPTTPASGFFKHVQNISLPC